MYSRDQRFWIERSGGAQDIRYFANRQEWTFASYSATGTTGSHWTYWSVVLEETTNNIYIGISVLLVGLEQCPGVRVDSATTDEMALSSGSTNAPDRTTIRTKPSSKEYSQITRWQVLRKHEPVCGAYFCPFTVSADFVNNGAASITGADINYSVNGGTATTSLTGLSIASGASATVTSSTNWTPSATGTYDVKVWLSNLNGSNSDANTSNDTAMISVQVVALQRATRCLKPLPHRRVLRVHQPTCRWKVYSM